MKRFPAPNSNLRSPFARIRLIAGSTLLLGVLMTFALAQEEPQFIPVLTPEAAGMFAEMPDTNVQIPEVYELLTVAIAIADIEDFWETFCPKGSRATAL